jgi:hypothetical protein
MMNKRDLIRKQPEKLRIDVTTVDDYLKKLAEQFTEFVKRKLPRTIEGEVVSNALYEERKERLQTGSGVVYEPAGRNQEEGRAEQSPSRDGGQVGSSDTR